MEDLDREVLPSLPEHLLHLLLDDLSGPVMGIDHLVADLILDLRSFPGDLEVFDLLLPLCGF
jgi:hypothetical protein